MRKSSWGREVRDLQGDRAERRLVREGLLRYDFSPPPFPNPLPPPYDGGEAAGGRCKIGQSCTRRLHSLEQVEEFKPEGTRFAMTSPALNSRDLTSQRAFLWWISYFWKSSSTGKKQHNYVKHPTSVPANSEGTWTTSRDLQMLTKLGFEHHAHAGQPIRERLRTIC